MFDKHAILIKVSSLNTIRDIVQFVEKVLAATLFANTMLNFVADRLLLTCGCKEQTKLGAKMIFRVELPKYIRAVHEGLSLNETGDMK